MTFTVKRRRDRSCGLLAMAAEARGESTSLSCLESALGSDERGAPAERKAYLSQLIARSDRQASLATVSHHVPTVSMIHLPEQSLPYQFTTIVADDKQRSDGQPK